MNNLVLTRKQVLQLAELVNKFPDTEQFTLEEISSSGVGPEIIVKFTLFNTDKDFDTTVNITDYSIW
jgi:hypothetical protein